MKGKFEIVLDLWGDFACFTRPEAKVERESYEVPTPSAMRGALNSIYDKPEEMYYQMKRIEVMNPIEFIDVKRNEVRKKAPDQVSKLSKFMDVSEERTQRHTLFLHNVYYRVTADVCVRDSVDSRVTVEGIKDQIRKRIEKGKCFRQPYLGLKECMCFFSEPDETKEAIRESKDLGIMLYDVFDIKNKIPLDTRKKTNNQKDIVKRSFFHANMINGVIQIPEYDSYEVLKEGD